MKSTRPGTDLLARIAPIGRIDLGYCPPPGALPQKQSRLVTPTRSEIEVRLVDQGIDDGSLNAELLIQTRELQTRCVLLLREINRRRISLKLERSALSKRRSEALNRY